MKNKILIIIMFFYIVLITTQLSSISFWFDTFNIITKYLTLFTILLWPFLIINKKTNIFLFFPVVFMQLMTILTYSNPVVISLIMISSISGLVLFGKKEEMKWYETVSSVFLIILILLSTLIGLFASGISKNSIIWEKHIPGINKSIKLNESDQGALGGKTFLVLEKKIFFLFMKSKCLWRGRYGERPDVLIIDKDFIEIENVKTRI